MFALDTLRNNSSNKTETTIEAITTAGAKPITATTAAATEAATTKKNKNQNSCYDYNENNNSHSSSMTATAILTATHHVFGSKRDSRAEGGGPERDKL